MNTNPWKDRWTVADAIAPLLAGCTVVAAEDLWTALGKPDASVRSLMDRIYFNSAMRMLGWRQTAKPSVRQVSSWRKVKVAA